MTNYTIRVVCKPYRLYAKKWYDGKDKIQFVDRPSIKQAIEVAKVMCPLIHNLDNFKETQPKLWKASIIHKHTKEINGYIQIYPT